MKTLILIPIFLLIINCLLHAQSWKKVELEVDVVINMQSAKTNGRLDSANMVMEGGANYFILEGFIYPAGYLVSTCMPDPMYGYQCGGIVDQEGFFIAQDSGVVIGTWDCMGWFTENTVEITEGPFDVSTQKFHFPQGVKTDNYVIEDDFTLVTDGYVERGAFKPAKRAITGTYGSLRFVTGDLVGKLIGLNFSGGLNFTTTFTMYVPN